MASSSDDDISTALRHLRPRPHFISSGCATNHGRSLGSTGPGLSRKRRQRPSRGYSSARYLAPAPTNDGKERGEGGGCKPYSSCSGAERGKVVLDYCCALDADDDGGSSSYGVFLTFEIVADTKVVELVQCSTPAAEVSKAMKVYVAGRIGEMFPAAAASSLFSVASRLLQFLNDNNFPTSCFLSGTGTNVKSLPRCESLFELANRISKVTSRTPASIHSLIDLYTILMRCAAAGRNKSKICVPVPMEFMQLQGSSVVGADALSHLIFNSSNQLYTNGFRGPQQNHQQQQTQQHMESAAYTFLAFLVSLPWSKGSHLRREKPSVAEGIDANAINNGTSLQCSDSTNAPEGNVVARLCLDVGTALGDPPPAFSRQANKYGTVQAYHGTKIESAWSILNYGLQNLSYDEALGQNGAMLGDGVYLTTSRRVAESFAIKAAEHPPSAMASAFHHESLLHLLHHAGVDVSCLHPLDEYDITCLPVLEATIIGPPAPGDGSLSLVTTRREGKYFVCPEAELIRITALHLTIELRKKSDIWWQLWLLLMRIPLWAIVLVAAILWAVR